MRGCFTLMASAILFSLPMAADEGKTLAAEHSAQRKSSQDVCDELLVQAQQVERILRSVSDRESADKAAEELRGHLDRMQQLCCHLEKMPMESPEASRQLAASMRSLTHVFQGYIPVVERLMEVNAYGSDSLVNVFNLYKVRDGYRADSSSQESPCLISFQEWADSLEYLLYHVRKLRAAEDIERLWPEIEEAGLRVERCRKAVEAIRSEADADTVEQVSQHLKSLFRELRDEQKRLYDTGILTDSLGELLNRCCYL